MVKFFTVALVALFFMCESICAQDGLPDLSFGGNGRIITVFDNSSSSVNDLVIQSDGKIIAGGFVHSEGESDDKFGLVRYHSDGSLDDEFGAGGKSVVGFDGTTLQLGGLILLPNSKIIAVGRSSDPNTSSANVILVRYNSDGSLDTSFGVDGRIIKSINSDSFEIVSCKLQDDGKIIVGGTVYDYSNPMVTSIDLFLLRFLGDGTMDSSFGNNGLVTTSVRLQDELEAVAIQNDGKIICTGASTTESDPLTGEFSRDIFVVRYKVNGELDTLFGVNGKVIIEGSDIYDRALAVKCQDDGKIIVAGMASYFSSEKYFMIVHLLSSGDLDTAFGTNGVKFTDLIYGDLTAVEIQNDGRIIAAEYHGTGGCCSADIKLLRFLPNGNFDSNFGVGGVVTYDFINENSQAHALAVQSDGKIVIGGGSANQIHVDFALARFHSTTLSNNQNEINNNGFMVCPNPVEETVHLNYVFNNSEVLSVDLYDSSGRLISNLFKDEYFKSGYNSRKLDLPNTLVKGIYFLAVSDGREKTAIVKIIK